MATKEQETSTAVVLSAAEELELESIRRKGAFEVARRDTVRQMYKQLEGCEWGSGNSLVRGTDLSPHARAALAHFCVTVGAHPQIHVVMFAGKPWLNADYWSDRLNTEPTYIDHRYVNISRDTEKREFWEVPEWATVAYEVHIRKLLPFAPIEKIKSGEITDWQQYVVTVSEANFAGGRGRDHGRPDPIGDQEPGKTARTRTIRRGAARAYPAWMAEFKAQLERAEQVLEAEWEEVRSDRAATNGLRNGPQALSSGNGEPLAASASNAQPLPVDDRTQGQPTAVNVRDFGAKGDGVTDDGPAFKATAAQVDALKTSALAKPFDQKDAHKAYFATLRDAGIADRKRWQIDNGFPESTADFGQAEYERAMGLLVGPTRAQALEGARMLGFDSIDELCAVWGIETPTILRELKELVAAVNAELDKQ